MPDSLARPNLAPARPMSLEEVFELVHEDLELIEERLARIQAEHARLARPWQVGHVISARPLR